MYFKSQGTRIHQNYPYSIVGDKFVQITGHPEENRISNANLGAK
jgi:hypothetical protein